MQSTTFEADCGSHMGSIFYNRDGSRFCKYSSDKQSTTQMHLTKARNPDYQIAILDWANPANVAQAWAVPFDLHAGDKFKVTERGSITIDSHGVHTTQPTRGTDTLGCDVFLDGQVENSTQILDNNGHAQSLIASDGVNVYDIGRGGKWITALRDGKIAIGFNSPTNFVKCIDFGLAVEIQYAQPRCPDQNGAKITCP